jgi:predicted HicB family RNase H-like nuclease
VRQAVGDAISERNYSGDFKMRMPASVHRALVLATPKVGAGLSRVVAAKLAA